MDVHADDDNAFQFVKGGGGLLPGCGLSVLQFAVHKHFEKSALPFLRYALVELGVDPDTRGRFLRTLLMFAARFGSFQVLSLLIDAGADVNARVDGISVVKWLFLDCPFMHAKAKLLVQCARLRPTSVADWCVSCPKDSWCHKTMLLFAHHAAFCTPCCFLHTMQGGPRRGKRGSSLS